MYMESIVLYIWSVFTRDSRKVLPPPSPQPTRLPLLGLDKANSRESNTWSRGSRRNGRSGNLSTIDKIIFDTQINNCGKTVELSIDS
jgi:hypothetical protein